MLKLTLFSLTNLKTVDYKNVFLYSHFASFCILVVLASFLVLFVSL